MTRPFFVLKSDLKHFLLLFIQLLPVDLEYSIFNYQLQTINGDCILMIIILWIVLNNFLPI